MNQIFLDIDGVIADFHSHFRNWIINGLIPEAIQIPPLIPPVWSYTEMGTFPSNQDFVAAYKRVQRLGFHEGVPTYPGAVEAALRLNQALPVTLLTARDDQKHTDIWLEKVGLGYLPIIYANQPKHQYHQKNINSVFIEDSPSQLLGLASTGANYAIIDHQYNKHVPGDRYTSLTDLVTTLLS